MKDLVGQTSGFMPRDLRALVADVGANLVHSHASQDVKVVHGDLKEGSHESKPIENDGPHDSAKSLSKEDVMKSLERSKKRNATALGTPKVKPENAYTNKTNLLVLLLGWLDSLSILMFSARKRSIKLSFYVFLCVLGWVGGNKIWWKFRYSQLDSYVLTAYIGLVHLFSFSIGL